MRGVFSLSNKGKRATCYWIDIARDDDAHHQAAGCLAQGTILDAVSFGRRHVDQANGH
ncbi:hypothetical protein MY10362_005031 [Beauveria mimosiformis]